MTTTLVLLAGGQGSRMGGADKGLLQVDGRPLVAHLLHAFAPQVDDIIIVANRNEERYRQLAQPFAARVRGDIQPGFQGPLMGILSALVYAHSEQVLVLPCDTFGLSTDLLSALAACRQRHASRACYARVSGRDNPVCCLLERSLLNELELAFVAGARSPLRWLQSIGAVACEFEQQAATRWSINTKDELATCVH